MPNIGMNASANIIGVVKRMDAPHSVISSDVRITIDGIEMIIVVVWKKAASVVLMPVMYMWCAHTTIDIKPRNPTDHTMFR